MTASHHTGHYGLSQYVEDDRPTYTGDYNGDMSKIDAAIYASSSGSFRNATRAYGLGSAKFDSNDYADPGVYYVAVIRDDANVANIPTDLKSFFVRASLVVCRCGYGDTDIAQLWLNRSGGEGEPFIAYRIHNGMWTSWRRLAFVDDIPDVSALTSRIAALESRVSALAASGTPGATGPAATQLDTQYSDDYNIVRPGMPTSTTESEELPHE